VAAVIEIRTGTRDDIGAVLAVWECSRSSLASTDDTTEAVERLLDRDPEALLVAVDGGAVVGVLVAGWDGWRATMYRLAVTPDRRRRGIALRLVEVAHERLHAKGARRVGAIVGVEEDGAVALWRAAGYEHDTRLGRFVRNL
jgi:ribosomal protein S18 acetylase RimI-like enzyme